jgi:hypothetical protein
MVSKCLTTGLYHLVVYATFVKGIISMAKLDNLFLRPHVQITTFLFVFF